MVGTCWNLFLPLWPVVTCQAADGERALLGDAWAAPALELQQGPTATATATADHVSICQNVSMGPGMTKIQCCERCWKMRNVHGIFAKKCQRWAAVVGLTIQCERHTFTSDLAKNQAPEFEISHCKLQSFLLQYFWRCCQFIHACALRRVLSVFTV